MPSPCFIVSLPGYLPVPTLEIPSHVQIPLPTQPLQQEVVVEVRIEPLPSPSHPSLGNHETPKPVFMVRLPFLNHPKPFPPLAWKAWAAQASPSAAF